MPTSMMNEGAPTSTPNMVQTLGTRDQAEQREDEEMNNEVIQDETFAIVQQGKGKGKGKKGVCWNVESQTRQ